MKFYCFVNEKTNQVCNIGRPNEIVDFYNKMCKQNITEYKYAGLMDEDPTNPSSIFRLVSNKEVREIINSEDWRKSHSFEMKPFVM